MPRYQDTAERALCADLDGLGFTSVASRLRESSQSVREAVAPASLAVRREESVNRHKSNAESGFEGELSRLSDAVRHHLFLIVRLVSPIVRDLTFEDRMKTLDHIAAARRPAAEQPVPRYRRWRRPFAKFAAKVKHAKSRSKHDEQDS